MRHAQLSNPQQDTWFFDDSYFFTHQKHNGYESEKVFGLKPNLLSQYFDPDIWNQLIENKKNGCSIPQSFKNLGFNIIMITEFENYRNHNPFDGQIYRISGNTFHPDITQISSEFTDDIFFYYHGYWQPQNWFKNYQAILKKELFFHPLQTKGNAFMPIRF